MTLLRYFQAKNCFCKSADIHVSRDISLGMKTTGLELQVGLTAIKRGTARHC